MEKLLLEWDEKSAEIKNLVNKIKGLLSGNPVPKAIRDGLTHFDRSLTEYVRATEVGDLENIPQTAKMLAVYGQSIAQAIPKFKEADENVKITGVELLQSSNIFRSMVEDSSLDYKPLDKSEENKNSVDLHSFRSVKENLKVLADEHFRLDQRVKKILNENEVRIENISVLSKNLEAEIKNEVNKVTTLYEGSLVELESKKSQIYEILGHVSGRAIAGDFEKSAEYEKPWQIGFTMPLCFAWH